MINKIIKFKQKVMKILLMTKTFNNINLKNINNKNKLRKS